MLKGGTEYLQGRLWVLAGSRASLGMKTEPAACAQRRTSQTEPCLPHSKWQRSPSGGGPASLGHGVRE